MQRWPLLIRMLEHYPNVTKFKYFMNKMIGVTKDNKLLYVETHSPNVIECYAPRIQGKKVNDIVLTRNTFMVLVGGGELHMWGSNEYGNIGLGDTAPREYPECVFPRGVSFATTNGMISVALTCDNKCFTWGSGYHGTGIPHMHLHPSPLTLPDDVTIKQIDCGLHHLLALGSDKKAYGWGGNLRGQLGFGNGVDEIFYPTHINLHDIDVIKVVCGTYQSFFMTCENAIFFTGINTGGVLTQFHADFGIEELFCISYGLVSADQNDAVVMKGTDQKIYVFGDLKAQLLYTPMEVDYTIAEAVPRYSRFLLFPTMMNFFDPDEPAENPMSDLISSKFDSGVDSDIEFYFPNEGKYIKAHRLILCLDSEYMRAQLSENWLATPSRVTIKDFEYELYYEYIRFLYTRKLMLEDYEMIIALLRLAKMLLEEGLKGACCKLIIDKFLNNQNCLDIFQTFTSNDVQPEYEGKVIEVIVQNMDVYFKLDSFRNLDPESFKKIALRYFDKIPAPLMINVLNNI